MRSPLSPDRPGFFRALPGHIAGGRLSLFSRFCFLSGGHGAGVPGFPVFASVFVGTDYSIVFVKNEPNLGFL